MSLNSGWHCLHFTFFLFMPCPYRMWAILVLHNYLINGMNIFLTAFCHNVLIIKLSLAYHASWREWMDVYLCNTLWGRSSKKLLPLLNTDTLINQSSIYLLKKIKKQILTYDLTPIKKTLLCEYEIYMDLFCAVFHKHSG